MQANVRGRVRNMNLPRGQGLLPLFEAIVNSIDAIEDIQKDTASGVIEVRILRGDALLVSTDSDDDQRPRRSIFGFEVSDNGIGFVDQNYAAFNEADTQLKAPRGGKGVGRFLWLKAFDKVEVDSTYRQDGSVTRRAFDFSLISKEGVSNHRFEPVSDTAEQCTTVRLLGMKEEYERNVPRGARTIAQRVVEHCLEYFMLGKMPSILVHDQDEDESTDLDDVYEQLVANAEGEKLDIHGTGFDLRHFVLHAHGDLRHQISYCADRRVVKIERVASKVPNLPTTLDFLNEPGGVIYAGYVSSEYLDAHVNQQRTDFDTIPVDGFQLPGELSWEEIGESVLAASRRYLAPYTDEVRTKKQRRIQEYVNSSAPQYRFILKHHPETLDRIPSEVSDDVLDTKLYEISRDIDTSLRQKGEQLLEQGVLSSPEETHEEQLVQFSQWWEEYNDAGKANLAKYIVNRKLMLELLEDALKRQATGKYSREELVHRIVFPLRRTSDDVAYDEHNLWILDEKLAYHAYLASDLPLNKVQPLDSDSASRPDLIFFFDRAIAVVDGEHPYGSGIVVFEFKRPMRDDYSEVDNPIQQVLRYVEEIKAGKARTKDGRPLNVPDRTPFYCYVVCDLTPRLKEQARFASLRTTPDGNGYFGFNDEVGAYIEVIGFDKLVQDANKRNRVLFEKLNLPDRLPASRSASREN